MKRGLVFFYLIIFVSIKLNSQNLNTRDSIIINSAPYLKWYSGYIMAKKDTNFQKLLSTNAEFKKQFDTAEIYFKLYNKRQYTALLNLYSSYGLMFVFLNNLGIPYLIIPSYVLLGYEFGQMNKNFLLAHKFFINSKLLLEKSGYDLKKEKWKVTFFDRWRYNSFTKRYERIKKRMIKKSKHLNLVY